MLGGNSSAAAPSFASITPPTALPPTVCPSLSRPCLPCFRHSPPEDTVFRGTRFHHISAPMPRPHSPAASSQTAQCGAMADTQGLNFSPAALLKEKKLVSITDRKGARTKREAAQGAHWNKPPLEPLDLPPAPFFGADLAPATGLCPTRALGVSQKSKERNLVSKH